MDENAGVVRIPIDQAMQLIAAARIADVSARSRTTPAAGSEPEARLLRRSAAAERKKAVSSDFTIRGENQLLRCTGEHRRRSKIGCGRMAVARQCSGLVAMLASRRAWPEHDRSRDHGAAGQSCRRLEIVGIEQHLDAADSRQILAFRDETGNPCSWETTSASSP